VVDLAVLFVDPIPLNGIQRALLLLPICLSIALVYKTIKCTHVGEIAVAALRLWGTIVAGMWAVAVTLWILYQLLA
jgi:hypothetical protein